MCGGAFEGMDEIIERRVFKEHRTIGFKSGLSNDWGSSTKDDMLQHVNPCDDLLEYGFIPEFVGRLPVLVSLISLDKAALVRVLTEPKNAFVRQYQCLFQMEEVELSFTENALEAAAHQALKQNTGARGLRTILEQTLLDVMYELPSMNGVSLCNVGRRRHPGQRERFVDDSERHEHTDAVPGTEVRLGPFPLEIPFHRFVKAYTRCVSPGRIEHLATGNLPAARGQRLQGLQ